MCAYIVHVYGLSSEYLNWSITACTRTDNLVGNTTPLVNIDPDGILSDHFAPATPVNELPDGVPELREYARIAPGYVANPSTPVEFIDNLYYSVLFRSPEEGGRVYWTSLTDRNPLRSGCAEELRRAPVSFLLSDELRNRALNSTDPVAYELDVYYLSYLGRRPEPGGWAYWYPRLKAEVAQRDAGQQVEVTVWDHFSHSDEFNAFAASACAQASGERSAPGAGTFAVEYPGDSVARHVSAGARVNPNQPLYGACEVRVTASFNGISLRRLFKEDGTWTEAVSQGASASHVAYRHEAWSEFPDSFDCAQFGSARASGSLELTFESNEPIAGDYYHVIERAYSVIDMTHDWTMPLAPAGYSRTGIAFGGQVHYSPRAQTGPPPGASLTIDQCGVDGRPLCVVPGPTAAELAAVPPTPPAPPTTTTAPTTTAPPTTSATIYRSPSGGHQWIVGTTKMWINNACAATHQQHGATVTDVGWSTLSQLTAVHPSGCPDADAASPVPPTTTAPPTTTPPATTAPPTTSATIYRSPSGGHQWIVGTTKMWINNACAATHQQHGATVTDVGWSTLSQLTAVHPFGCP